MADSYRHHALIEAPLEDVWGVVSDPQTHPEWWPDVVEVEVEGPVEEGGEYTRTSPRVIGFRDQVDAVWVAERLEHLKEARFRCTVSGTYARFSLTPAQDNTFVEAETGILPTNLGWRFVKLVGGRHLKRWLSDVLDALPGAVRHAAPGDRGGNSSTSSRSEAR